MAAALAAQGLADVRQLTSVTAGLWPGSGSIWWNRATASMPDAAFVNAFASHCLDFDSVHYGAFGHPAVVILPALLAAFEVATGPGEDVICSYLVGAEVMAELAATFGLALQERGLHSTPILGCLAVAAALGWFLKLDQPGLESAFTLASVGASGFVSSFGSISKSYQVALACRNGLVAAQVARAGVWVGGAAWLQNLVVLSGVLPQSAPIRPFGRPWAFEEVSTKFKRYPVCGYFQQVLDRLAVAAAVDSPNQLGIAWTCGWSWRLKSPIFVPAQLVYLPYAFQPSEPVLRDPLTTGASAGLTYGKAVLRGLLEVVERDATMIVHYRKLQRPELDLSVLSDPCLGVMTESLQRYNLDATLYDFSLDLPLPVVAATVVDRSGEGPAVTVGSKASFDLREAARGALLEAACFRRPMRERLAQARKRAVPLLSDYAGVGSGELRAYLWMQPEMLPHLGYLGRGSPAPSHRWGDWRGLTEPRLRSLIDAVLQVSDIIVADVTTADIASFGVQVVKVILPGLQPMHLCERDRCWTKRLLAYDSAGVPPIAVRALNAVPHPFL